MGLPFICVILEKGKGSREGWEIQSKGNQMEEDWINKV